MWLLTLGLASALGYAIWVNPQLDWKMTALYAAGIGTNLAAAIKHLVS